MDRNDVNWRGYWPACPTPVRRRREPTTPTRTARCSTGTSAQGMHGVLVNGTTGEWFSQTPDERRLVAETAIEHVAGRVPVVVGCTSLHGARGGRAAAGTRSRPAPTGSSRRRRRTRRRSTTRPSRTTRTCRDAVDAPLLVYNWLHGTSVDIGPELADRLVDDRHRRRAQGQHAERRAVLRDDAHGRRPACACSGRSCRRGARASCSPTAATASSAAARSSARPTRSSGRTTGAATRCAAARTPSATDGCSRSSGCPGGWGGVYGGYQSQLKAIMKMIGQPGGEPRPPRLPVDRPGEPRRDRARSSCEESLLPQEAEAA